MPVVAHRPKPSIDKMGSSDPFLADPSQLEHHHHLAAIAAGFKPLEPVHPLGHDLDLQHLGQSHATATSANTLGTIYYQSVPKEAEAYHSTYAHPQRASQVIGIATAVGVPASQVSSANGQPRSPKKVAVTGSNRTSIGKAAHLPFLNLAALKHYSGWQGSPIKPPTPLAQPPTPLAHPPFPTSRAFGGQSAIDRHAEEHGHVSIHQPAHGNALNAHGSGLPPRAASKVFGSVKMERSDAAQAASQPSMHSSKVSKKQLPNESIHPFALASKEPQQYMSYDLGGGAPTTAAPDSSPLPVAAASTYVVHNGAAGMSMLSPPPTPGGEQGNVEPEAPHFDAMSVDNVSTPPSSKLTNVRHAGRALEQNPDITAPAAAPAAAPVQPEVAAPSATIPLAAKEARPSAIPTSAAFLADGRLSPVFAEQYDLLDELGSGGFGFVIRARRKADGLIVAVKFIFRERIPSHGWVRTRSWDKTRDGAPGPEKLVPLEAYVLRMIRHPGVVAFLDLIEDDAVYYLVMEHHGTPWVSSSATSSASVTSADARQDEVMDGTEVSAGQDSHLTTPVHKDGKTSLLSLTSTKPTAKRSMSAGPGSDDLPDISYSSDLSTSPSSSMGPPTPITPGLPSSKLAPAPPPMLRRSSCDLFECIEQHSRLPEEKAKAVFGQIVEVVYYLAAMGICHRDIKDENIVVDKNFRVKLIDFGSAVIYDVRKAPPYHHRFFGTVNFAASEILQGQPYRAPHAEVWSLGVLLSILLTGETPFSDPNNAIMGRISKPKCHVPAPALDLMFGCLEVDPEVRMTIAQVRNHAWLRIPGF